MAKKRTVKRPWNKGFEMGQKDALTPAQVKRVRHVLARRGVPGLRDLALFSGSYRHHAAGAGATQSDRQRRETF